MRLVSPTLRSRFTAEHPNRGGFSMAKRSGLSLIEEKGNGDRRKEKALKKSKTWKC